MALEVKRLIVPSIVLPSIALLCALAATAGDKEAALRFSPRPAASYPSHQTNEKVTIAAVPFYRDDQARAAFGKANPNQIGVLPVLIVIQNDSDQTLFLENMRVQFIPPNRERVDATPAKDVPYLRGPKPPNYDPGPVPAGSPRVRRKKNPLAGGEIDVRAFAARMLPPGESASGFFYFQTGFRPGSTAYVTGLGKANSGQELFYFEIPLSEDGSAASR